MAFYTKFGNNFLLLVLFICLSYTFGSPVYFRGRIRGGNLGSPPAVENLKTPPVQWFTQRLTHFDTSNPKTWQQRYFINSEHYRPGGPVFLMIGGEGRLNPLWMVSGQWVTRYAPQFHALCVSLEHRFYGDSHPTSDVSDSSLVFLSSEQALADLAHFQSFLVNKMNLTDNKWITFGGSYPGSLSAWYRLKYPHLVSGAVASSAPLQAILDFKQYMEVVTHSLRLMYGESCNQAFRDLNSHIKVSMSSQGGRDLLKSKLRLCNAIDPTNVNDVATFYMNVAGNVEGVVQYNRDNRAFEGGAGSNITIQTVCGYMTDESLGDALERYAQFNSMFMAAYKQKCFEFSYSDMINDLRDTSWSGEASEGGRQWTYQTCAEFGFFQSSDAKDQPFGDQFPVDFFTQQCVDIFGATFNATTTSSAIKQTNEIYGSMGIKASNTVFVNGNVDPWHALSLVDYAGPQSLAVLINGTAHCANMYPDSSADPLQLKAARDVVSSMIGVWLDE